MKNMISKMLPVILLAGWGNYTLASDPVWEVLGEGLHYGFSPCIAIDHNDIPYVAYTYSAQPNVMKYNGSSWEYVGNENFSTGMWASFNLAINSQGIPYVAYQEDSNNGYLATSMKYNGVDGWELVGKQGFGGVTYENTYDVSLAIDNDDIPLVIFSKIGSFGTFNYMALVYQYKYGSWSYVDAVSEALGGAREDTITVAKDNTRYIAYSHGSKSAKLTVKRQKANSSSFTTLGSEGFTDGGVSEISLATDSSSTPYVAFRDNSNSYKATVMKYYDNNNTWMPVGQAGFTTSSATNISLAIDGSDTLYILYATSYPGNISVMTYDGSTWVNVGAAYFVNGALYHSLALDSKGTPYITYKANDGTDGGKVTVMYAPSVTCKHKDQAGNCIPGVEDPGWTGPYPEVPFEGNYGQGDATQEASRIEEPGWPIGTPYPDMPCPVDSAVQGSNECTPG